MAKKKRRKRKKSSIKSHGHKQVSRAFKRLGFSIIDEYCIGRSPYDIFIPELNLIVEYYGNRWHYYKEIYPPDYWDKVKKQYVWEKWQKDRLKREFAEENGYNIEVIWEYDWKKASNKTRFVEKLAGKYKNEN